MASLFGKGGAKRASLKSKKTDGAMTIENPIEEASTSTESPPNSRVGESVETLEAEIEREAYYLWRNEGCLPGREIHYWLRAEELIRARRNGDPS
ncbi:MAG TPA: DUF2934 domain-containing protein [Planctomycetia bacterium]|nr:DUF2934 domain-containing protein [Planctomycetia bacterium]